MKQRVTYLLPESHGVDYADIKVGANGLDFLRADKAAEEWRLTLGLNDLPDEVQVILRDCHELHLRWTSPRNEKLLSPLVSRLPSGLHAFFTPRNAAEDVSLCDLLRTLSGGGETKCHSVPETFSKPPILSERFATSSTYQYYQLSDVPAQIGKAFLSKLCNTTSKGLAALDSCESQLQELATATYIDIDFDAISHTVVFTASWSGPYGDDLASRRAARPIRKPRAEDRVEVGVLQSEKATEPEELSLGGYLTVLGEDDHPKATQFSFPSRHHPVPASSPATFQTTFQQPTGLHPKLQITVPRQHLKPPRNTCVLHAYWTLPSTLFIDRYQLSDPLFLASQNLIALRSLSGEQDLEAPEWVTKRWGSAALLELATPQSQQSGKNSKAQNWTITIPTHLRYLDGRQHDPSHRDQATIQVPWPILFWACEAEEGLKMSTNPFDRVNLGYDGLFGPKTMFYHIPPASDVKSTVEEIKVPVLNAERAEWVQVGTLIAVVVGFAWVCWQLLRSTVLSSMGQMKKRKSQ